MANLTIQRTSTPAIINQAAPAVPVQAKKETEQLVSQTRLDNVSLSQHAKTSKGLNLRESAVAAGMTMFPAAGLALMHDNKMAGIGYGLGMSAGAGLAYMDFGNSKLNTAKNIVAGAVIGGSLAGTISNQLIVKTLLGERAKYALAVGAVAGAGVAVYREFTK